MAAHRGRRRASASLLACAHCMRAVAAPSACTHCVYHMLRIQNSHPQCTDITSQPRHSKSHTLAGADAHLWHGVCGRTLLHAGVGLARQRGQVNAGALAAVRRQRLLPCLRTPRLLLLPAAVTFEIGACLKPVHD